MNTARILSIAAVAAFASMGAYAAPATGEFSAVADEASFQSTRTRAEVVAEAVQAAPNFKNFYVAPQADQLQTVVTRATVRAQGRMAIRANQLAIGNLG